MTTRRLPGRILALTPGDRRDEARADARDGPGTRSCDDLVRRARAAIEAGLDSILLREPDLSDRATLELAHALRAALGPRGWLAIHDRVHLAVAAQADAVHVGFRSLSVADARAILPDTTAIGFSAHAHDDPNAWTGADYLVFGPVFATPSKAGVLDPVGLEVLASSSASTPIPMWALGGIHADNAPPIAETECRGIAVRAALLGTRDAAAACRTLRAAFP